jgi:hypothetical protein
LFREEAAAGSGSGQSAESSAAESRHAGHPAAALSAFAALRGVAAFPSGFMTTAIPRLMPATRLVAIRFRFLLGTRALHRLGQV